MIAEKVAILRGGEFLINDAEPQSVFIPEEVNEEQKMLASMAREFQEKHVWPKLKEIDRQEPGLTPALLDVCAELGLLGAALPEEYGGMNIDTNTEAFLTEILGASGAFCVSFAAHTGIGTLPVLYFGTEEQKQKYLPGLADGSIKAAYCLTEPGSGSDALGAKTRADLNAEGTHYVINGQKMWITNAGFADLLTVFAQIDGDKFTAFLVDAKTEGVKLGAEEDKLGIKGSSTRQIFFEDAKVPVENVLGEIGKGHKIAFNVLNIGRYKLGLMVCGGAKVVCDYSVKYANERQQFKMPISKFGAIKHKLAEQATRIFALESANYRTSNLLSEWIEQCKAEGKNPLESKLIAAEEYAIECSIIKVLGSEVLDYVVDEAVQIYGGMGFSEEAPAARAYRDARINRIFEGTNEINRMLMIDMLLKRAMNGTVDLMTPAMAVQKELLSIPDFGDAPDEGIFTEEKRALRQAKKAALMVAGAAVQKFMHKLAKEQEILMSISDMLIDIYAAESAMLRTEKLIGIRGEASSERYIDMTRIFLSDAMERININGKHAVCAFAEGDELQIMFRGLRRFTKYQPFNTVAARRRIAQGLIDQNGYWFFLRSADVN